MICETTEDLRKMIDGIDYSEDPEKTLERTRIVLRELLERIVEIESKIITGQSEF